MVNVSKAMDVDGVKRSAKHMSMSDKSKNIGIGKEAKKEAKMLARKEKKIAARTIRNKKTKAEFSNHKSAVNKNNEEKLNKNVRRTQAY